MSQERPSAAVPTTSARRQVPFGADHKGEGIPDPGRSKGHSSLYERVLKTLKPYSIMIQEEVDLEEYKMEPLKAVFRFDADEKGTLYMEPLLSYGNIPSIP